MKENFNVYSEIGISPEPFGLGAEIGFSCFANDYISFRGGFFLLGGSEIENVYGGLNIATRLQLKNKFSPIIGFGLQAGYSEETDPVFDDKDIDNLILLFYPEFGLQFKFKGNYLITFTTRYNSVFTTEEEVVGSFWRFYFAVHLFGFFSLF